MRALNPKIRDAAGTLHPYAVTPCREGLQEPGVTGMGRGGRAGFSPRQRRAGWVRRGAGPGGGPAAGCHPPPHACPLQSRDPPPASPFRLPSRGKEKNPTTPPNPTPNPFIRRLIPLTPSRVPVRTHFRLRTRGGGGGCGGVSSPRNFHPTHGRCAAELFSLGFGGWVFWWFIFFSVASPPAPRLWWFVGVFF